MIKMKKTWRVVAALFVVSFAAVVVITVLNAVCSCEHDSCK